MSNIFYNIFSIVIGFILVCFFILNIKKSKLYMSIVSIIHGVIFIAAGISGFFIPKEYGYITILWMLALCITMLICILLDKKDDKTKTNSDNSSKNKSKKN